VVDAVLAAQKGQLLRACVPDVARDIQEIHRDPRHGHGGGITPPCPGEVCDESRWYDDLKAGPAETRHGLAAAGKPEVPRLVDGQVEVVERVPVFRVPDPHDGVNRDEDESYDPNARPQDVGRVVRGAADDVDCSGSRLWRMHA